MYKFKEKYPYVRVDTLEPLRMKDIFTKISCILQYQSVSEYDKDT